ncbi:MULTISPECIES: hypothetical protein [Cupriavidus]|uniref:Uncharacterized protein n=1 Tax=Cupriavidus basilensis TaxID=68895 RepID=A0A643FR23_9BURK|nr:MULTISPECIES: hypothetical protein [Cupriavidus]KUE86414.1 hypothetical protein ASL20_23415 [Cupriavidus necator]NOV23615.1 hypothetical protein [Cupriavidus necator]QOT81687.1 hypothetical protein F7R26_037380 [Cupriavidus basilensis]BDB30097.1 hypothetical protein CTP10_R75140 [Cupriavidus sp. P-10]
METTTAGWQLDFFGEAAAIVVPPPKLDPLPDPSLWSKAVREKMVDALISLACDSRRGDNMPESLIDCAEMLRARMRNRPLDLEEYSMTLGWIFGYWNGALPYSYVCAVSGVDPETLQDVILNHARLRCDLDVVRRLCCGSLL